MSIAFTSITCSKRVIACSTLHNEFFDQLKNHDELCLLQFKNSLYVSSVDIIFKIPPQPEVTRIYPENEEEMQSENTLN